MPTDMDEEHPLKPADHGAADAESDGSQQAYDRFVDGQAALTGELGESVEPPRPSRKSAWLAMVAVVVALGLLWLAPGVGNRARQQPAASSADPDAGQPGDATIDPDAAADALATGKPAPLQFTMQDMNGVDVKLASFKGKVILLNFW